MNTPQTVAIPLRPQAEPKTTEAVKPVTTSEYSKAITASFADKLKSVQDAEKAAWAARQDLLNSVIQESIVTASQVKAERDAARKRISELKAHRKAVRSFLPAMRRLFSR